MERDRIDIVNGPEFPMKVGDRLLIRYGNTLQRLRVYHVNESKHQTRSKAVVEAEKGETRVHGSSRAYPRFPGRGV